MTEPHAGELVEVRDSLGNSYRLPAAILKEYSVPAAWHNQTERLRRKASIQKKFSELSNEVTAEVRGWARRQLERIDNRDHLLEAERTRAREN